MKIDFNTNSINPVKIKLLDSQVDLIMRSLELYAYIYRFAYPGNRKYLDREEELRISLIINTYEQISSQYNYNSKFKNIYTEDIFKEFQKNIS